MLRIIDKKEVEDANIIEMNDMEPLQVAEIVGSDELVMRTANSSGFEIIDLSDPSEDGCWEHSPSVKVRLLSPNEKITIELFNE